MAKIISIVNQKGGVGKTTTCVSLTAALAEQKKRVLLCDFDPQANSTSGMGVDKTVSKGVYEVLVSDIPAAEAVAHTRFGDVLPSNKALAGAGIELIGMENREYLLRDALETLRPQYDYIFIDCPPSLELLTLNALCASNSILVPVQGEYFALEGLSDLMNTVRIVRRSLNPTVGAGGCAADHVRRADKPRHAGSGGSEALLPRQGLRHGDSPQRPALRGAQSRKAHHGL